MDWVHFQPLAYGCKSEYAVASEDGLRLPMNGRLAAAEKPVTPVAALQQGLPVLMYVSDTKSFEQRVVKVDNRLTFLYVLVGSSGGKEKQSQPIVVGLNQIWSVREGVNALALCDIHEVKDENLTSDSAVVVELGQHRPDTDPPLSDLLIFCTPPKLRLKERILACSAGRGGCHLGDKGKQMVPHLDGVRIKDYKKLWRHVGAAGDIDLDVQFLTSSGHPGGKSITIPKSVSGADKLIEKIHKQNPLTPIDAQRIQFVILETEAIQKWAVYFNSLCSGDFYTWLEGGSKVKNPNQHMDSMEVCVHPPEIKELLKVENQSKATEGQRHSKLALDSVRGALKQLLDLELRKIDLEDEEEKWHTEHEKREAEKIKAPSRLISKDAPGSSLDNKPLSVSDAGSVGRRSIESNRRSLEPGWDLHSGSPRAALMAVGSQQRSPQQHEMVLPEAMTVVNQNPEIFADPFLTGATPTAQAPNPMNNRFGQNQGPPTLGTINRSGPNQAPGVVNNRFGPNQADATSTSAGTGRLGPMPVLGAGNSQAPSEASLRGRSAEDEANRLNAHLHNMNRAEKEAMERERSDRSEPQNRGFFDSWLSTNMPGVAKIVKKEFECGGFGR